jgi:hypothetical protein
MKYTLDHRTSIVKLLKSRTASPLLEAAMDGTKNPIKILKYDPNRWWPRKNPK